MGYKNFILILVVSLFVGCVSSDVVIMTPVSHGGWRGYDYVEVEYDNTDTTNLKRLSLVVRVNEYYIGNILFSITTLDALGREVEDNVLVGQIPENEQGRRYCDIVVPFRDNVRFKQGLYCFRITHKGSHVEDVHAVGVEITPM